MSDEEDGGPAFPNGYIPAGGNKGGMSLRDYFAAALLQGNLDEFNHTNDPSRIAAKVYRYADAMLAERTKRESKQ